MGFCSYAVVVLGCSLRRTHGESDPRFVVATSFEQRQCRVARGSESRFGDLWGPVGWNPKQIAPKRGSVWYILAVRNAKKEILGTLRVGREIKTEFPDETRQATREAGTARCGHLFGDCTYLAWNHPVPQRVRSAVEFFTATRSCCGSSCWALGSMDLEKKVISTLKYHYPISR